MSYDCSNKGYTASVPSSYPSSSCGYSGSLEDKVSYSKVEAPSIETIVPQEPIRIEAYSANSDYANTYLTNKYVPSNFIPNDFLNPMRPRQKFIGASNEVINYIKETFMHLTGEEFPDDIVISVCNKKQMKKIHPGWHESIQGFAINRKDQGKVNEIFVLNNELDKLMLIIGHEIGHVMSMQLENPVEEEAKAFAFSLAWMDAIVKNNIANLAGSININTKPANNGIHNAAFDFVAKYIKQGKNALDVFKLLMNNKLKIGM